MKTAAGIYRVHRLPSYDVKPWQVIAAVVLIGAMWSSMVLGAVLVARHAWYATLDGACHHYGPRVEHGPARVSWQPPPRLVWTSDDVPLTWALPPQ